MQATISTRKVINGTVLFTLLFPRLIAFAERAWHRASWENTVKRPITNGTAAQIQEVEDFLKFKTILGKKILPKLDEHKVQYYMAPPGAVMKKVNNDPLNLDAEVTAKTEFPGLVAQIKTNLMQNFEDVVNNKKYGGSDVEFRTRNRDNTVFGRTEVVFKNATDIYMREHVKLTKHLHDSVYLEFPIQTRDIGKDDPDGRISYSLQDSLPLYFDKEFGYFFNKTGFEKFRRDRPALVEQARIRQQQHMLMMQEHRKRMMALNAARANNQNSMNQVGNVGNNQGGARPVGWTPGSNQNMIQGRQGQNG